MSAPRAEAAPAPLELGHLVEAIDFSGVVDWAKGQDIPPLDGTHQMIGSLPISIDSRPATVGWIKYTGQADGGGSVNFTPEIEVANAGGEDIIVVEGGFTAHVHNSSGMPKGHLRVRATPNRPGFLQLQGGDKVIFHGINGPDQDTSWYVCFYPEAEA